MTLGIEGGFLCVQVVPVCASMIVNRRLFGIAVTRCVYLHAFASASFQITITHFSSSLHMKTHLTQ